MTDDIPMIHHAPIVGVDVEYTETTISSVRVKFLDQTEAVYGSVAQIDEVFKRIADQQKMVEQADHGVETQGTSA